MNYKFKKIYTSPTWLPRKRRKQKENFESYPFCYSCFQKEEKSQLKYAQRYHHTHYSGALFFLGPNRSPIPRFQKNSRFFSLSPTLSRQPNKETNKQQTLIDLQIHHLKRLKFEITKA